MSTTYTLDWSKLKIDPSKISFEELKDTIQAALMDVNADHERKYDQGQRPDGSAQKPYSKAYAEQKMAGKVSGPKGTVRGGSITPNLLLTGEMRRSKHIRYDGESIELYFAAKADIASFLESRGFGLHYFSQENIDLIEKAIAKRIDEILEEAITID